MESFLTFIKKILQPQNSEVAKSDVVVRIPPSPTGNLHVGTARTALANYLFAKRNNGKFILRIEDTDKERSKKEYEENILEGLEWLGIHHDNETLYRQSERTAIYKLHIEKMISDGTAYISKEEGSEEGKRNEVIRFKNPNKTVTFEDQVRGEITFDTTELGDFVIAKSIEEPLYHLTVVVDDFEMHVTHVIRGEDHISNTPRQILLQEAIGASRPIYAHLPLLLGEDKSKLSKRHGAQALTEYRDAGYLPEALINYLALLGWNPGTDEEFFSMEELATIYDLDKAQKGGAVFSPEKLNWYNQYYIKQIPKEERVAIITEKFASLDIPISPDKIAKLEPVLIERIITFNDIEALQTAGELDYYYQKPTYDPEKIHWKKVTNQNETVVHLAQVQTLLENKVQSENPDAVELDHEFTSEADVKERIWEYADNNNRGDVLWPLRYALSGKEKSPDPFTLAYILGKDETLARITDAIECIKEHVNTSA